MQSFLQVLKLIIFFSIPILNISFETTSRKLVFSFLDKIPFHLMNYYPVNNIFPQIQNQIPLYLANIALYFYYQWVPLYVDKLEESNFLEYVTPNENALRVI